MAIFVRGQHPSRCALRSQLPIPGLMVTYSAKLRSPYFGALSVVSLAARKTIDPCEGVAFTPEHIYIERLADTFHLSTRLLGISLTSKVDPIRMSSQATSCAGIPAA